MASTMSPDLCIEAIAQMIDTIPAAGTQIHKQRRILRDEREIKRLLYDPENQRMCGWFISPAASNTTVTRRLPGKAGIGTKGGSVDHYVLQFQVEVYFELNDAADSETVFRNLVWAVVSEFNAYGGIPAQAIDDPTGGGIPGMIEQFAMDCEVFSYAMLAGLPLVHFARLTIGFNGR